MHTRTLAEVDSDMIQYLMLLFCQLAGVVDLGGGYKILKYRNSNGGACCMKSVNYVPIETYFGHACPLNSVWGPGSYRAVLNATAFDTLFMGSHSG